MQISLFVPTFNPVATPDFLSRLGRAADAAGVRGLWVPEHVVLFEDYTSVYPYAESGRIPIGPTTGLLEPLSALAFLASATERVRLGTAVLLVPQRNPVYTAKQAATVDWLSRGRLDLGIGVGWLAEEFAATATPFARRGARCREYLEVIRRLWCDEISEYKGEFYTLPACRAYPKPIQQPHPPCYFGGESDAALQRVADLGQGWHGFNLGPAELEARLRRLEAMLPPRGRRLADLHIAISPYLRRPSLELLRGYRDAGANEVVLALSARSQGDVEGAVQRIADEFIAPLGA